MAVSLTTFVAAPDYWALKQAGSKAAQRLVLHSMRATDPSQDQRRCTNPEFNEAAQIRMHLLHIGAHLRMQHRQQEAILTERFGGGTCAQNLQLFSTQAVHKAPPHCHSDFYVSNGNGT